MCQTMAFASRPTLLQLPQLQLPSRHRELPPLPADEQVAAAAAMMTMLMEAATAVIAAAMLALVAAVVMRHALAMPTRWAILTAIETQPPHLALQRRLRLQRMLGAPQLSMQAPALRLWRLPARRVQSST